MKFLGESFARAGYKLASLRLFMSSLLQGNLQERSFTSFPVRSVLADERCPGRLGKLVPELPRQTRSENVGDLNSTPKGPTL